MDKKYFEAFRRMDEEFTNKGIDTSQFANRELIYFAVIEGYKLLGGLKEPFTCQDRDFLGIAQVYLTGGIESLLKVAPGKESEL